jgi:DNA-binding MarR family transcriptional regulator
MDEMKAKVIRKAIVGLISHDIAMLNHTKTRKHTKALRYFNSTPTRELFAKLMVHARLTDHTYSVSDISDLLSISHLSALRMVNDSEEEGWVKSTRGRHGRRLCIGTRVLEDMSYDWISIVFQEADRLKLGSVLRAFEVLEDLDQEEQSLTS